MPHWSDLWRLTILHNSLRDWAIAGGWFLVTFALLRLARSAVDLWIRKWASRRVLPGVELLARLTARTHQAFLWAVAAYVGARFIEHPPRIERLLTIALILIVWAQVAVWAMAAVRFALDRQRLQRGDDPAFRSSLNILVFVARAVVFSITLLLALDNLGVNITALVAGLGIGGIAVALAVQTLLGDLFASLSIALDKPFTIGDALRIDDCEGAVEHIGIKSTRLRSVSGEQIILSNADLLKSRVRNLGRMPERRALINLGVAYGTPRAKLDLVPGLVEAAVRSRAGARLEYCLLRGFGDSALNFEICYFCENRDPRNYLDTLDAVNRRIYAAFEEHGIAFAHPTRTVILRPPAAGRDAPVAGA